MAQVVREVELSLADIFAIIKKYRQVLLIAPIIFGIAAYILVAFVIAPKWEASGLLQVGQVGPKLVEPIANVVARMLQPSFAVAVLSQTNFKPQDLPAVKALYENSLKVKKIPDADLVEFHLKGYSSDMARTLAISTVSYLQKNHDEMMAASVAPIKAQIQSANGDIQTLRAEMDSLKKQLQDKHDWNSSNATLAAIVLQDKSNQLRELIQRKQFLDEQLSPTVTFTTKTFGDVTVSEGPVSPKKPVIIGMAILLGLFSGIFIAFVHNWVSKENA
jgi:capsular polysaccharide biosynthesis protein